MNDWHEAEQRVERAYEMYRSGRWEEALRELRAALKVDPMQGEWHFNVGLTLDAMGRHAEAAGAYRKALAHQGHEPQVLNHLGAASLRAGRPAEALEAFAAAASLEPDDETSYIYRIDAYRQLGDHDSAEVMFYAACQIDDANARAYILMAQSLLDRELADRAIGCLKRALELDPRDDDVHAHLAEAYRMKGDMEGALEESTVQVGLHPGDTLALLDLARTLTELGRPVEAAARLRRVIELDPLCAEAHFELGWLAMEGDHDDAAQLAFEKVLEIDASFPGAHQALAAVALRRGQLPEARRHLAAEWSLVAAGLAIPRDMIQQLGGLLFDAGMYRQARELLEGLTEHEPVDAQTWHELSTACFMDGDVQAGIRHARQCLRADPKHLTAMQNLAVACLQQGHITRAGYWIARARRVDEDDPRTAQLRGQLWFAAIRRLLRSVASWG